MPLLLVSIVLSYFMWIHFTKKYLNNPNQGFHALHQTYRKIIGLSLIIAIASDIFFHSILINYATSYVIVLSAIIAVTSAMICKFRLKKLTPLLHAFKIAITCAHLVLLLNAQDDYASAVQTGYAADIFELLLDSTLMSLATSALTLILYHVFAILEKFQGKPRKNRSHSKTSWTPHSWFTSVTPSQSKNMKQHYQEHGMTSEEISYFREHMGPAKDHIVNIQNNFPKTAKLRAIESRHNSIKTLQTYFKDIVQNPTRLAETSHFLCKILPTLDDLITKYNEIQGHIAKNKQTYQILDRTATTIDTVCQEITQSYINFHGKVYKELEDELAFAQQNLHHVQTENTQSMEDILDQDIQEASSSHEDDESPQTNPKAE